MNSPPLTAFAAPLLSSSPSLSRSFPTLIRMVIRPQLMPTYRAGVVLVLNETKNHGWLDTLIATMMLLHSKSTYLFEGFTRSLPAMEEMLARKLLHLVIYN